MSNVFFPSYVRPAIRTMRVFRNGRYPEAGPVSFMQEEANRICAYRLKQWSFCAPIADMPSAGGASRSRWRAYIHTSTHCRFAYIRFLALPSNNAGNPITQVGFTLAGDGAPSATVNFIYESTTEGDTFDAVSIGQAGTVSGASIVDLVADQDYEITVTDVDNARTLAICIFEVGLQHTTANGYVENGVVAGQDILDVHRGNALGLLRDAWLINGSPLITWASDTDADAFTNTGISANIIDSSASVSTASAGFTLDLRNRSTVRRSTDGVPVIMRAYHKTTATTGAVRLLDSTGAVMATCTTSSGTAAWVSSGVFYLPETLAKYDLHGSGSGIGTQTIYAVSLYSASDV